MAWSAMQVSLKSHRCNSAPLIAYRHDQTSTSVRLLIRASEAAIQLERVRRMELCNCGSEEVHRARNQGLDRVHRQHDIVQA